MKVEKTQRIVYDYQCDLCERCKEHICEGCGCNICIIHTRYVMYVGTSTIYCKNCYDEIEMLIEKRNTIESNMFTILRERRKQREATVESKWGD